ncbi:hypothetical protein KKA95_03035 [Patescibacteria group bacterium]|nr:hypothetical protein [Patescibacteria group bacterium]
MKKILKLRKLRGIKRNDLEKEIATCTTALKGDASAIRSRQPHKVVVDGTKYRAVDAAVINRHMNQSGRGDYRLLFIDSDLCGLAVHKPSGSYAKVA